MNKTVGILGCGWLGFPLAKSFISDRYKVNGSTTSHEKLENLEEEGINSYLLKLEENSIDGPISIFLEDTETLIINVPPRLRGNSKVNYIKKMETLNTALKGSGVRKAVFVSSTSVFGDHSGKVTEKTSPRPLTESGRQLLVSEQIFKDNPELDVSIVRFGGLIGPKRHPVSMLTGKKGLKNGDDPVNLIHLDDCIGIIKAVVHNDWWGEIFNATYPLHPLKRAYYSDEARKRGLSPPKYSKKSLKSGKIVVPYNLLNVKKYRFKTSIVG